MAYYLGIDGGGSKTTCVVGDEASLLAGAIAGPSNVTRVGEARARESLQTAIRQVCATAKIDPRQVQRACVGVAGAGREEIAAAVRGFISEIMPADIEVVGDMQIALAAAFSAGPGVIVIAGTGSIAFGRDDQGKTARAGGWGFAISDEGSAHWIGRAAVSAALRAADEGNAAKKNEKAVMETSLLLRELKAAWKLDSIDELVRTANSKPDFAALFPAVVTAADAGDHLADSVLAQAGRELAQLPGIVFRRLFAEDGGSGFPVPLAIAGGVFRYAATVREVFSKEVSALDRRFALNPQVVEPVAGALQMARQTGRPL